MRVTTPVNRFRAEVATGTGRSACDPTLGEEPGHLAQGDDALAAG